LSLGHRVFGQPVGKPAWLGLWQLSIKILEVR
jgi:hypothetical protein